MIICRIGVYQINSNTQLWDIVLEIKIYDMPDQEQLLLDLLKKYLN